MRSPAPLLSVALFALIATLPPSLAAQQKATFASRQEALMAGRALSGGFGPRGVTWIDGGNRFSYIARGDSGEEIRSFDPATGKDELLFSGSGLTYPGTDSAFRYQSFQWARDSRHLVFQTNFQRLYRRSGTSDFYVYTLANRQLQLAARGARTGELSPDGSRLGYERDGDMFVTDLATGKEARLTSDATDLVHNGRFDWVYEEEFGVAQAWKWSPDSRNIAYWQLDEGPEPIVQLTDFAGLHPEWDRIRIPQPGDSNAHVRIGVSNVVTGQRTWLEPGADGGEYIPRIYWTSEPDTLAVVTLNRSQNEMKLFFFDIHTGGKRLVMTEQSPTWVDVYDFYAGVEDMLTFPAGVREFFWISDRDGWQHLYRYGYDGKVVKQVTSGAWSVTRVEGTDPAKRLIYFMSTKDSPLERQLYSVKYDGSALTRLTRTTGTHSIDMSPNARFYFDSWSSVTQPRQIELWTVAGKLVRRFEDNADVTRWIETHAYSPTTLFSFTTSDGQRLDGSMVRPWPFDSTRRYPVIFAIYGGPGSQQVYNSFGTSGWTQWLAQEGYIVVGLNNRGSNNYGSKFMKVVHEHLGKWESHDFAEAARYLATLPYVDGTRFAIMGTSYGGYSTVFTMEAYPDIFKVGIANSAVTDWRLYDNIYTERYMNTPALNPAGYDSSSAVKNAKALTGRLLLIHSMMDDNVHPQNTMQLLTAMTNAGHDVDTRIYPPGRHGAAYNGQSSQLIMQVTDQFLAEHLKSGGTAGAALP
jgi:dipeptidyl-peptidase-4